MKHTPGPWTIHREQNMSENFMVLGAPERDERYPTLAVHVVPEVARFTKINNALLIAAAPDLLAALKAASDELVLRRDSPLRAQIDAALQSASGSPEDAK